MASVDTEGLSGRLRTALWLIPVRRLAQKYLSRPIFFARYMFVLWHWEHVGALREAVRRQFTHSWVTDVTVVAKPLIGESSGAWPFLPRCDIHADAPLTLVVWHKDQQALIMSGWIEGGRLFIRQLQGAKKIKLHRTLYMKWPELFMASCQEAARTANLKEVRLIPSSRCLVTIESTDDAQEKQRIEALVRERLLTTYDQTAERLGFAQTSRWHVWHNPAYRAPK